MEPSARRDSRGLGDKPSCGSRLACLCAMLTAIALLTACSSMPARRLPSDANAVSAEQTTSALGDEIAMRAISQVGKPYRYGGADLQGFDCSGLVFFIHRELGVTVPRTAVEQYQASTPVNVHSLLPGDLLFFRTTRSKRITHVGIYAGDGRFVHAPQTGRTIELRELSDEYYGPRLVGAGRMYASGG